MAIVPTDTREPTRDLIYLIECDDVYDVMKRGISRFDTYD